MVMRVAALVLGILAGVVAMALAVKAGDIGPAASMWRNVSVLLPSVLAAAGGVMCLNHPMAATYLLGGAALIFGLGENWIGLALVLAAGALEFHFGRPPNT
jgi:hypothetical protein